MDIIAGTSIDSWVQIVLAVIGLASVIVKITPTKKDDIVLGVIKGFVSKFVALNDSESADFTKKK